MSIRSAEASKTVDVPEHLAEPIERIDVAPVAKRPLYAPRVKIYPKRAHGTFRSVKWIVMAVTLGIYYTVPWIRWDRGPYMPDQAVLIDFPSRRFFFFFLEIWPQEFYYITGLLVLAALGLFLVTHAAASWMRMSANSRTLSTLSSGTTGSAALWGWFCR